MRLTIADAKTFVRARIDELSQVDSDMVLDTVDDRNLGLTVEKSMEEAVNWVHLHAPASMLFPTVSITGSSSGVSLSGGVIDIKVVGNTILRVARCKVSDGMYAVTMAVPEDSAVGHMQLNEYVRGVPDRPVLVEMADSDDTNHHYRYYTTDLSSLVSGSLDMAFVERARRLAADGTSEAKGKDTDCYLTSEELKEAVLNYLTGMVLVTYGSQDSQFFMKKAVEYMPQQGV